MDHLKIGINVPWNASWTAEDTYEVRNCRWASGMPAMWSPHRPGEGRPIFAKPHMVRQRRSIMEMRCTVCGEKTDAFDRYWFRLGNQIDGWSFATTEAPVHFTCARLAMEICPHLTRLGEGPVRFDAPDGVVKAIVGGPRTEGDYRVNLNGRKVVGHLKFVWRYVPFSIRYRDAA